MPYLVVTVGGESVGVVGRVVGGPQVLLRARLQHGDAVVPVTVHCQKVLRRRGIECPSHVGTL